MTSRDDGQIYLDLGDRSQALLDDYFKAEIESFVTLAKCAKLNPRMDFRYADLEGVDFSNSDLRGFDFTGANLSGSFGVNVLTDHTTILDKASLLGSVFATRYLIDQFLEANPEVEREIDRLKDADWITGSLWVVDAVFKKRSKKSVLAAQALFRIAKDEVVRNQILFFMRSAYEDKDEYKEFLLSHLGDVKSSISVKRNALSILSKTFYNDSSVINVLRGLLSNSLSYARVLCFEALLESAYREKFMSEIKKAISGEDDPAVRKIFLKTIVKGMDRDLIAFLSSSSDGGWIDYSPSVSKDNLRHMVRQALKASRFAELSQRRNVESSQLEAAIFSVSEDDVQKNLRRYDKYFDILRNLGVPFRRSYSLS